MSKHVIRDFHLEKGNKFHVEIKSWREREMRIKMKRKIKLTCFPTYESSELTYTLMKMRMRIIYSRVLSTCIVILTLPMLTEWTLGVSWVDGEHKLEQRLIESLNFPTKLERDRKKELFPNKKTSRIYFCFKCHSVFFHSNV